MSTSSSAIVSQNCPSGITPKGLTTLLPVSDPEQCVLGDLMVPDDEANNGSQIARLSLTGIFVLLTFSASHAKVICLKIPPLCVLVYKNA